MDHLPVLVCFAVCIGVAYCIGRRTLKGVQEVEIDEISIEGEESEDSMSAKSGVDPDAREKKPSKPKDIHAWAEKLSGQFSKSATTAGLIESPRFQKSLVALRQQNLPAEDLTVHLRSDNDSVAALAMLLARDRDDLNEKAVRQGLLKRIRNPSPHLTTLALEVMPDCLTAPVLGSALAAIYEVWDDYAIDEALEKFVQGRLSAGEALTFGDQLKMIDSHDIDDVKKVVKRLPAEIHQPLLKELDKAGGQMEKDPEPFLKKFGTVLETLDENEEDGSPLLSDGAIERQANVLVQRLMRESGPRSVLLTGASRVGKSTMIRLAARALQEKGFLIVSASAAELQSGQMYIGQLEERIQNFVSVLQQHKIVWIADSFHEIGLAGRHRYSSTSILDMILPHLAGGSIRVLGEVSESALEKLALECPRLESGLDVIRINEVDEAATLQLGEDWINEHTGQFGKRPSCNTRTLVEAYKLASQYALGHARPGLLLDLLKDTFQRECEAAASGQSVLIDRPVLLRAIAARTGMPLEVIDEERALNLESLRELFAERVKSQPEAVTALVERVAMIKAGLTDPSRPLGVFLFAGPTGTGKTEIAKTLTEFLFGSSQRMIRLDMSEFQTPAALTRITGGPEEGKSLASRIRQQPFSLILLDEFEKADQQVWDLFLQVFDDGRLTDSVGNTADLRNSIIILTSNLGALTAQGNPLGFSRDSHPAFQPREVEKAIEKTFRKEFVNRIDRIVTFRPLSRETMRSILTFQLQKSLGRRGLRNRPWEIEWDESATELLLDKGFSPTMGARPLLRAIDQFFLGPLARDIVEGLLPPDEQLLFVYALDGRLQWDSSLDSQSQGADDASEAEPESGRFTNRHLILQPLGSADELAHLHQRHRDLEELLSIDKCLETKNRCLEAMQVEGFWKTSERFEILAMAEYIDRVEASLKQTGELLGRLVEDSAHRPSSTEKFRTLIARQSERLYLMEQAYCEIAEGQAMEAMVVLNLQEENEANGTFAKKLRQMYENWGRLRGMKTESVAGDFFWAATFNGFGAFRILQTETGLHHWCEGRLGDVATVAVNVCPLAPDANSRAVAPAVVIPEDTARRYQRVPTPLVTDKRRSFRTGRLDLVLNGHFDLIDR